MLLSALIPVICFGAAIAAELALVKLKSNDKNIASTAGKFRMQLLGGACVLVCITLLLSAVTSSNMINGERDRKSVV